ncbi:MAG TPA: DUF120 domain-containing protein [Candidatus Bilamarchaeaceae archaeon]|nr:DUF120 domain-containing protein [Candidatus Bilamarchaeaceae archaeon]
MDDLLFLLLRLGAHKKFVQSTTIEIGNLLKMSQQNASRKILLLEKENLIERKNNLIKITKKGMELILQEYLQLKQLIECETLFFVGAVVEGLGEGKYYLSLPGYKKAIKDALGFEPYPGTLNLKLDEKEHLKRAYLKELDPILVKGFSTKERTFGDLFAYPCVVDNLKCAIIVPVRTHHGTEILEIIAPSELKKKIGDKVRVELDF